MPTSPIGAVGATGSTGLDDGAATSSAGMSSDSLDREAFLKLLVAQLKYQDPTKPADTSQMLTQTAQLTMVDRLNEMTAAFNESAATQRLAVASSLVGNEISFVDADGVPNTGHVDSVRVSDGKLVLQAGDFVVPYEAITAVIASVAPPVSPATVPPPTTVASPTAVVPPVSPEIQARFSA